MSQSQMGRLWLLGAVLVGICLALALFGSGAQADEPASWLIAGSIYDQQGQPVEGAQVALHAAGRDDAVAQTVTQPDGRYTLSLETIPDTPFLHVERAHFEGARVPLDAAIVQDLRDGQPVALPDVILERRIGPAFWIATSIFAAALILIAIGKLHNVLAVLLGTTLVFAVSYLGHAVHEDLVIFGFERALQYVDWNVIFLIMGMMIIIAVVERTGVFQWLAFSAYRISGGRAWLLLPILMIVTGVASAFLDNVTTMLLMTPITIQIALAMGINPLTLLIPEVMASNVVGVSTLIGTPTNILIGSFGDISFGDLLANLTPGVLLALVGLIMYSEWSHRRDLQSTGTASSLLMDKLAERGRITKAEHLKKAAWVGGAMVILFVFGERVHLVPSVTALMGATALLLWIKPDVEEMIEAVDWTTLVFFIALFILVGAVQEVGLISVIAAAIGRLVGGNLVLAMLVVTWAGALLSTVIANIPFTAAMLPVVGYLTTVVPGAESKVLFYCLSVGSGMGGNGSLIGASANIVTTGIAERAGYSVGYAYFLKKGIPALLITVGLATVWLLIRFM
jgi:Na+/H+ antiporter NhaD/arsenite permease-like protein